MLPVSGRSARAAATGLHRYCTRQNQDRAVSAFAVDHKIRSMTTLAVGRCTSAPVLAERAIGKRMADKGSAIAVAQYPPRH
jgi:hypothetical protein